MSDQLNSDRLACKIQHFLNIIESIKSEKEIRLLTIDSESCDKEVLKSQIFLCQEIQEEYYDIFKDILYKE